MSGAPATDVKARTRSARVTIALAAFALLGVAGVGCGGGEDFANEPRPPVTVEITGVITNERVTVAPNQFGAGPVSLTISNQTPDSHTIILEGEEIDTEEVGPINPMDTATLQKTLPEGTYEVSAESREGISGDIAPGEIVVGQERSTGSDDLLLP